MNQVFKWNIIPMMFLLLLSCGNSNYEYWDISKFDIQDDLLEENEQIVIFYTTRAPDYNKDFEYFIHLIGISQESGDTINILTPIVNGFNSSDIDKVYNFIPENSRSYVLMLNFPVEESSDMSNLVAPSRPSKVLRDPKFDSLADNDYPSIIGMMGFASDSTGAQL